MNEDTEFNILSHYYGYPANLISSPSHTEGPKIYRKSVLQKLSIPDAVQICGKFWDTQYFRRNMTCGGGGAI